MNGIAQHRLGATAVGLSLLLLGAPTPAWGQTQSQDTIFENATLAPGFSPDPLILHGLSGGTSLAQDIAQQEKTETGPCEGFVDTQPDHRLTLSQFFNYLRIEVKSNDDTTLVIRGPGGSWCNNNYATLNPGLAGQWLSGTYDIWVGSLSKEKYSPYILSITAQPPPPEPSQSEF
jgi:hypothetical protein